MSDAASTCWLHFKIYISELKSGIFSIYFVFAIDVSVTYNNTTNFGYCVNIIEVGLKYTEHDFQDVQFIILSRKVEHC